MPIESNKRALTRELLLAFVLVAAGLAISVISLAEIAAEKRVDTAQATQPLQGAPATDQDNKPAESKPGGERPTTPAPQPARPDPEAQASGAKPVLPPAPAEKVAPPIKDK